MVWLYNKKEYEKQVEQKIRQSHGETKESFKKKCY